VYVRCSKKHPRHVVVVLKGASLRQHRLELCKNGLMSASTKVVYASMGDVISTLRKRSPVHLYSEYVGEMDLGDILL